MCSALHRRQIFICESKCDRSELNIAFQKCRSQLQNRSTVFDAFFECLYVIYCCVVIIVAVYDKKPFDFWRHSFHAVFVCVAFVSFMHVAEYEMVRKYSAMYSLSSVAKHLKRKLLALFELAYIF